MPVGFCSEVSCSSALMPARPAIGNHPSQTPKISLSSSPAKNTGVA